MIGLTINAEEFDFIRDLVHRNSAIVIGPDKKYFVEARLSSMMQKLQMTCLETLMRGIRTQPIDKLHHQVIHAMTTNETLFFRDVHPFEALRRELLPKLIQSRSPQRTLNVFFAGCSTGQEPYSVAIMLRESFPEILDWNLRLTAVDISLDALERAQRGIYTQFEMNRGLPATCMVKFFRKQGLEWHLHDDIRRMVEFRQMNIAEPLPPLPSMDIIFMRNILIYFNEDTKKGIFRTMRRQLKPDGCLFLGTAETPMYLDPALEPITLGRATYYRQRSEIPQPHPPSYA